MAYQSAYTRKTAVINANPGLGTDATIVAAVPGKRIRVTRLLIGASVAANVTVKSAANTVGLIPAATTATADFAGSIDDPVFETNPGEALIFNPDAAAVLRGTMTFVLV